LSGIWTPRDIADAEIAWAAELMGLGTGAFEPIDGNSSRMDAIRNMDTADFEACPGSGKTTLLVAKLAILANRWSHPRQGICVLSHTNAARNEIGSRLGASPTGISLLRYPHFIGTIHSFVNEFLALPWLRSKGNPIRAIDDQIALKQRMASLAWNWRQAINSRPGMSEYALAYDRPDYTGGSKGGLAPTTPMYKALVEASRASSGAGYFCYDEMFVWANELIEKYPAVIAALRTRFPLVFVDEAQDNSELQSALLHKLFCEGANPSRRQRFGDSNQAIYAHTKMSGAITDMFPSETKFDLPRSYRFAQSMADQVKPFGVKPQELVGAGPSHSRISASPKTSALFLFDDRSVGQVLARYAAHLMQEFSAEELDRGVFSAVAGVHDSDRAEPIPCSMGHYAPHYDAACARRESSPDTFAQFLARARFEMGGLHNVHPLVNATASGILFLANLAGANLSAMGRRSPHRRILELLEGFPERARYLDLINLIIKRRGELDTSTWDAKARPLVVSVASTIAGAAPKPNDANGFLKWPVHAVDGLASVDEAPPRTDNLFRYPHDEPRVHIRLGSIHSVKGETHTATLVLESFYHSHHLSELKPWLLGTRSGGLKGGKLEGNRMLARLKLHYVAMTRPSHVLCMAMRKDALTEEELAVLLTRGWQIVDCCELP
jgi:DNA helicase II / ATP-dependent DNA helicase PcrA